MSALLSCVSAPTDRPFEQFLDHFPAIPLDTDNLRLWTWPEDFPTLPLNFLATRALDVRAWAEQHLQEGVFGRDDYRELCELIIKFLGGRVCIIYICKYLYSRSK